nr:hypothetical protein [Tanacetum cinerariifolium]
MSTSGSADVELSFSAVDAIVVRAQPKDFMAVKKEWPAIRIQSVFCSFLFTIVDILIHVNGLEYIDVERLKNLNNNKKLVKKHGGL